MHDHNINPEWTYIDFLSFPCSHFFFHVLQVACKARIKQSIRAVWSVVKLHLKMSAITVSTVDSASLFVRKSWDCVQACLEKWAAGGLPRKRWREVMTWKEMQSSRKSYSRNKKAYYHSCVAVSVFWLESEGRSVFFHFIHLMTDKSSLIIASFGTLTLICPLTYSRVNGEYVLYKQSVRHGASGNFKACSHPLVYKNMHSFHRSLWKQSLCCLWTAGKLITDVKRRFLNHSPMSGLCLISDNMFDPHTIE